MKLAPIDPPEIEAVLWHGFTGQRAWDIGANGGQSIPHILKAFDEVIAFEPATECVEHLSRFAGNPAVTILPMAISDRDGSIDLIELPDKIDSGQLVTGGIADMEWDSTNPGAILRRVPARSVDSLVGETFDPPHFMKIDVEGHELKILVGARQTLTAHRPDMLIEFHSNGLHDDCLALLLEHDYDVTVVRHPHYARESTLWHTHGWLRAFGARR